MSASYAIAGFLVGTLVGVTGVGGGSIMAPLLILMFGFNPAVAVGTDLWFAAISKSFGGAIHRKMGSPDWLVIRRLAMGSIPASVATLVWLGAVHGGKLDSTVLLRLLGAALVVSGALLPLKTQVRQPFLAIRERLGNGIRPYQRAATIFSGAAIGVLVTITSVGAGALVAVALLILYPLRLDTKSLVGTDIIHAIPLALVAAIGQSWLGNVNWSLLGALLIGSIPGITIGAMFAGKVDERIVRGALSVMLIISGVKLILN
ncbi:hypothetical protein B2G71_22275 [Novosphingobium sp. PC22D]|uniref:sulfite exporter TauE/SafE family protein n=1 Tax=Novosphingobium sp. PC22D TaxID=1962403 RepID=UPI000BF124E8|nr:sulfite exporter TauE/SafE family protein [Novosphingobium sp. PC22D]PEQ10484.1 hypothetical protein B2G71_22275 [Novosphingobium sp. PC22D]